MKKLFGAFLLSAICLLFASADTFGQTRMTESNDSNINAVTTTHIAQLGGDAQNFETLTFTIVGTKVSGTVAGTAVLYGSLDNVTYFAIGADTLSLTDVATQAHNWTLDKTRWRYYKIAVATTGTQVSKWVGTVMGRKTPK